MIAIMLIVRSEHLVHLLENVSLCTAHRTTIASATLSIGSLDMRSLLSENIQHVLFTLTEAGVFNRFPWLNNERSTGVLCTLRVILDRVLTVCGIQLLVNLFAMFNALSKDLFKAAITLFNRIFVLTHLLRYHMKRILLVFVR